MHIEDHCPDFRPGCSTAMVCQHQLGLHLPGSALLHMQLTRAPISKVNSLERMPLCHLLRLAQEQGLEFLPMGQRIKRDWHTWRQHLKSGKGMLNFNAYVEGQKAAMGEEKTMPLHQAPQPYQPMTREAEGFHPGKGNTGLFNVDAVESVMLQRSNSVAY